jgi:hypothetical protein
VVQSFWRVYIRIYNTYAFSNLLTPLPYIYHGKMTCASLCSHGQKCVFNMVCNSKFLKRPENKRVKNYSNSNMKYHAAV